MVWGAADALGEITGISVSHLSGSVPAGVEHIVGDHPVPGARSLDAGRRVLETASEAGGPILALVSGGGSALCEQPLPGITPEYLAMVNQKLLDTGAPIGEMNLIRRHLSAVKCGGVSRAAGVLVETLVLSDVNGAEAHLVASGPSIPSEPDPDRVEYLMSAYSIPIDDPTLQVIRSAQGEAVLGPVTVLADGRTAGEAVVAAAASAGFTARLEEGWNGGDLEEQLRGFVETTPSGVNVAVGEPSLAVEGKGSGGRNTHAALLAADSIRSTETVFCAFATDGIDGRSNSAGAIVDGDTLDRGGDPTEALSSFDSATYLATTRDLIHTGPTGTNVSDLWILWKD
jgi:glycerate 2-kinase